MNAFTAPAMALRVVSAPAGKSRAKKAISSASVSPEPSSSERACTIVDMMPGSGWARLWAMRSMAYVRILRMASADRIDGESASIPASSQSSSAG